MFLLCFVLLFVLLSFRSNFLLEPQGWGLEPLSSTQSRLSAFAPGQHNAFRVSSGRGAGWALALCDPASLQLHHLSVLRSHGFGPSPPQHQDVPPSWISLLHIACHSPNPRSTAAPQIHAIHPRLRVVHGPRAQYSDPVFFRHPWFSGRWAFRRSRGQGRQNLRCPHQSVSGLGSGRGVPGLHETCGAGVA